MNDYLSHIQFEGATWRAFKSHLEKMKENKIRLLVSEDSHDKSNRIRGAIEVIDQLLALDKPTMQSANRGN